MPVFRTIQNHGSFSLGLWKISEPLEVLSKEVSQKGFLMNGSDRIVSPLKRRQWMAARLMLNEMLGKAMNVHYMEDRAPYLVSGPHISLSHSGDFACVMLCSDFIPGVDIQEMSEKILRVKEKFANQKELELVADRHAIPYLNIIWCAKEAIYKACRQPGLIFNEDISIHPFEMNQEGDLKATVNTLRGVKHFDLHFEILDNYALVYTLNH